MQDAEWFLEPDNEIAKRVQKAPSFESGICDESGYTLAERDCAALLERGGRLAQWAQEAELLIRNIALRNGPIGDVIEARKLVAKLGKWETQDEARR